MICPNCLANNKNNATVCKNCGASLFIDSETPATPAARRSGAKHTATYDEDFSDPDSMPAVEHAHSARIAERPSDLSARRPRGGSIREHLDYRAMPQEETPSRESSPYQTGRVSKQGDFSVPETAQETICVPRLRDGGSRTRAEYSAPEEGDDFALRPSKYEHKPKKRSARRVFNVIFTVLVWIVALGAIGYGVYWAATKLPGILFPGDATLPSVTRGSDDFPDLNTIITVKTDENGDDYIDATFYGRAGDSIYLNVTGRYYPFEGETLNLHLYLRDLISADTQLLNASMPVDLQASYRLSSGLTKSIDTGMQTLNIPENEIVLLSPTENTVEVFKQNCTAIFSVDPGSTLTINDMPANDKMDSSGTVNYSFSVPEGSTVVLNIKAYSPYKQMAVKTLTFIRKRMDIRLTLSGANPKKTAQETVTIQGSVDPKATLKTSDNFKLSDVDINPNTGTFSATLTLPQYGNFEVPITAEIESEGKSSTLVYEITYAPNENSYTRSAWKWDPDAVRNGRTFVFSNATVLELLPSSEKRFIINAGTEDAPERIIIEYFGGKSVSVGSSYRIFATVIGTQDGMPLLISPYLYPPNY